ncbi:MAG: nicotinate-nucleotide adenylyltransferase [Rhodothermales bacterium]|nr:nicotinate-nucleotide adenylyltransferase [Rhodothermales bacterium]
MAGSVSEAAPRRLGLFGGSFNPPHLAHLAVAEAAREQADLDRVLWLPAATSPFKQGEALPAPEHRLAMTRLAVEGNPAFGVSDVEVRRGGVSYTVDTVRAVQAAHPEAALFLLLGGDGLAGFRQWRAWEELLGRVRLLVYRRPGSADPPLDGALRDRVSFLDAPPLGLSSTYVRGLLRAGRSARYLVPDAVLRYAEAHGLYATG